MVMMIMKEAAIKTIVPTVGVNTHRILWLIVVQVFKNIQRIGKPKKTNARRRGIVIHGN